MSNWLTPGRKIVCVNNAQTPGRIWYPDAAPTVGAIYTIKCIGPSILRPGEIAVYLVELINPHFRDDKIDCGYKPSRFRPVIDRKTDISELEQLLKTKHLEDA